MNTWSEKQEEKELFRRQVVSSSKSIFDTKGSAGSNNQKLAQILGAYDIFIQVMGWTNKPIANLADVITGYQASLNGRYHNDYKAVLIAEEIARRQSERRGFSITQN